MYIRETRATELNFLEIQHVYINIIQVNLVIITIERTRFLLNVGKFAVIVHYFVGIMKWLHYSQNLIHILPIIFSKVAKSINV